MQNPAIARAVSDLEILSHDPDARVLYEARKKYWLDYESNIEEAKEEGKYQEKLAFAKEMKAAGEPLDRIMKYTHLTKEEIDKL